MTVTVASFRTGFPEFADETAYPESFIQFWLDWATKLTNKSRWGNVYDLGVQLQAAHNIVLEKQAQLQSENGNPPGTDVGPVNNKSVDKVSVGLDTGVGTEEGGGNWNLTTYGTRYLRLAKMIGSGPLLVGCFGYGNQFGLSASAWAGPPQCLFPNDSG